MEVILEHLHNKIDIVVMASITLLGFMITALSVLKAIAGKEIKEIKTLYLDILQLFKLSIYLLLLSSVLSLFAFFIYDYFVWVKYISLLSFAVLSISLFMVYRSVKIIFLIEK